MTGKLRVGVIGLGMGRNHISGYQAHPGAEVVAIADIDPIRLKEIGDKYEVPRRYDTADEMMARETLDVVSIATPNLFHHPMTLAAFKAGCHVMCEKPMALNAAEAREMLAAAQAAGKRLMIDFSYRFNEQSMMLKKQVDSGALGQIYFGRTVWHRRRGLPGFGGWFGQKAQSGGGPLIDLGVHRLDLALWLMGYPQPVWALGSTYNHLSSAMAAETNAKFDVEDLAAGLIKFDNGATLVIEASWAANIKESELMETRLYGTQGGLVQRNLDETYKFEAELFLERDSHHFDMKVHPPFPPAPTPWFHFIDCILSGKPHMATGGEGLKVMQILDALYQSAADCGPVKINQ